MKFKKGHILIRKAVRQYVNGQVDIFKVIAVRPNNRYDVLCTVSHTGIATERTGRRWNNISGTLLRPLFVGDINGKNTRP